MPFLMVVGIPFAIVFLICRWTIGRDSERAADRITAGICLSVIAVGAVLIGLDALGTLEDWDVFWPLVILWLAMPFEAVALVCAYVVSHGFPNRFTAALAGGATSAFILVALAGIITFGYGVALAVPLSVPLFIGGVLVSLIRDTQPPIPLPALTEPAQSR